MFDQPIRASNGAIGVSSIARSRGLIPGAASLEVGSYPSLAFLDENCGHMQVHLDAMYLHMPAVVKVI
jgi:hypothetical protein